MIQMCEIMERKHKHSEKHGRNNGGLKWGESLILI